MIDLYGFDIVFNLLPESMHNQHLGIIRRLIYYIFNVDTPKKFRGGLLCRLDLKVLNEELLKIKVPSEFRSPTREMAFGCYKAEEFRNLVQFEFIILFK